MKTCNSCPFAMTPESEMVQNYGCLRSASDILKLKDETGHNWACHSNNRRICRGLASERDVTTGGIYLQPGENSDFISWKDEDQKPIIKMKKTNQFATAMSGAINGRAPGGEDVFDEEEDDLSEVLDPEEEEEEDIDEEDADFDLDDDEEDDDDDDDDDDGFDLGDGD